MTQRFCGDCGACLNPEAAVTEFAAAAATPSGSAASPGKEGDAGAELRWVSVVFVDLVGFTSWSESRDPEDVRDLLSGYFDVARRVVERYGGVVEKFIGDAVMAVWGAPIAREDDAERAVRAALELVAGVEQYGHARGVADLEARSGVVTGRVASWRRPAEGLVTGDRVNTAARVQTVAKPGTVLVDDSTRWASLAGIIYESAGDHVVKGKLGSLRLWRAVRVVAPLGGTQRLDGLEAALIGRRHELALVKELFHSVQEGGRARLVVINGVAGVGKSRLGREFETYVDTLDTPLWWHRGHCPPYGDGVAFWPLAELVRQCFDISPGEPSSSAARKLDEGLPRWVPESAEREFVSSALRVLVGAGQETVSRPHLFAGWRLFIERKAAAEPLVWLIEDMHWADAGLLNFLENVMEWSAELPIFILALARLELLEQRGDWMAGKRNVTSVHLDPLDFAEIRALLEELVPAMPFSVRDRIAAHAQGIPLFAVETIRSLVDRDLVVASEGTYALVGEVGEFEVPLTLTSLLASRLDGLPHAERNLVKGLAVLGGGFTRSAIVAVAHAAPAEVDAGLAALRRKEVLTVHSDPLSAEGDQYAFTQEMLRTVAYNTLTKTERRRRHLAVASYLRDRCSAECDAGAEVVAAHYHAALRMNPNAESAAEIRELAVEWFQRAGRRARAVGALDTAERSFLTVADLTDDEATATRCIEEAGQVAEEAGRWSRALALIEDASRAHESAARPIAAARLSALTGHCLLKLGRLHEALETLRHGRAALERAPVDAVTLAVDLVLARVLNFLGQHKEGEIRTECVLRKADELGLPELRARAFLIKAEFSDDPTISVELLREAVEIFQHLGLIHHETRSRINLGDKCFQVDLTGAVVETELAIELARKIGDQAACSTGWNNLALMRFFTGDWEETEVAARRAIEVAADARGRAHARFPLLLLHAAAGRRAMAEAELEELLLLDGSEEYFEREALGVARALVALMKGDIGRGLEVAAATARECTTAHGLFTEGARLAWPMALRAACEAQRWDEMSSLLALVADVATEHVPPYLQAQMLHYRALLNVAKGDHTTVEADLRRSIEILDMLSYPYWRANAQVDLGCWLAASGDADQAELLLGEAKNTYLRLGARPALDRMAERAGTHAREGSLAPPTVSNALRKGH